jgi:outer membrane lipoprotein-sorting protein
MTISRLLSRGCLLLALAGFAVLTAGAAEPAIIAKARSFLGGDAALDRVTSLHYVGKLTLEEGGKAADTGPVSVEIIFQKPSRQRSVIAAEKRVETTVLDGFDGWSKVQDPADATRWSVSLMEADQIRSLRANVTENLSFFRNRDPRHCTVEDLGPAVVDGVTCRKVGYVYSPQIAFFRYFDAATGRLVLTETAQGETIREQGEIIAGGVRFPRTLVTTLRRPDGSEQRVTIEFEQVTVNETFPDSLFAMPSLGGQ